MRAAYDRFYTLDYDGALRGLKRCEQAHPDDPMAADYVLETVLFHELYNLDLLDTTLYAHDGFLSGKHQVVRRIRRFRLTSRSFPAKLCNWPRRG